VPSALLPASSAALDAAAKRNSADLLFMGAKPAAQEKTRSDFAD
jgi:hypothetical protein